MNDHRMHYETIALEQPWGNQKESVRIFPPCQVRIATHKGAPVVVFVKERGKPTAKRRTVRYFDLFPSNGFVAWDDTNNEYAWHEVGTIDVPSAVDPKRSRPIIRGESEPVGPSRRKRRSFKDWFLGKAPSTVPDFLQETS